MVVSRVGLEGPTPISISEASGGPAFEGMGLGFI